MTDAPDRLTVSTCIGCGAMSHLGTCQTGCSEQRLDLVRAGAHDALTTLAAAARESADAFRPIAERLASHQPSQDGYERSYRELQQEARTALRRHPDPNSQTGWEEPAEPVTTWWCERCGGIDAPQPCLGICVWRHVEWVNRTLYEQQRARTIGEHAGDRQLRRLLRRIAFVIPRAGQWERSWQALQRDARRALDAEAAQAYGRAVAGRP